MEFWNKIWYPKTSYGDFECFYRVGQHLVYFTLLETVFLSPNRNIFGPHKICYMWLSGIKNDEPLRPVWPFGEVKSSWEWFWPGKYFYVLSHDPCLSNMDLFYKQWHCLPYQAKPQILLNYFRNWLGWVFLNWQQPCWQFSWTCCLVETSHAVETMWSWNRIETSR